MAVTLTVDYTDTTDNGAVRIMEKSLQFVRDPKKVHRKKRDSLSVEIVFVLLNGEAIDAFDYDFYRKITAFLDLSRAPPSCNNTSLTI